MSTVGDRALQRWDDLAADRCQDWRPLVEAGQALVAALRDERTEHATVLGQAEEAAMDAVLVALPCDSDDDGLADEVEQWHRAEHDEPWQVCRHSVCRAAQ